MGHFTRPIAAVWCLFLVSCAAAGMPGAVQADAPQPVIHEHPQHFSLSVGKTMALGVSAKEPWNKSCLLLKRGQQYEFHTAEGQRWKDAWITVDPDGKSPFLYRAYMFLFSPFKRARKMPWMALVGNVGNQSTKAAFLVGSRREWKAPMDGELYFFANDVPGFYWNNSGRLALVISRVK